ncbi:hypothetical protein BGZ73_007153 [Actinomortierella ambigua]|nr:hypothetical protein BGZ73_007153 [Actinomortierella ambigua]
MRLSIVCLLAAALPAACFARQDSFCGDTENLYNRPAYKDLEEKVPGWVFLEENRLQARVHGNTFWNIKGKLDEKVEFDEHLFDPVIFTLNSPEDFKGRFKGHAGRGEFLLKWEKSGATIVGRSPIGDYFFTGESWVDYSP